MGVTLKSLIFILRNEKMEIKQVASKEIEFDIRKKPSGKVNGVFKDKEENLNRFSYGKGFEISGPSSTTFDVYNMELTVPPEFTEIDGVLSIMLDGSKFLEIKTMKLTPGLNTLDIDQVVSRGIRSPRCLITPTPRDLATTPCSSNCRTDNLDDEGMP